MSNQILRVLNKSRDIKVKIIMSIRLLLGFYSKIHDSVAFAVVAKTYCFIYATVLLYLHSNFWDVFTKKGIKLSMPLKLSTFISTVILSLLTDGEHLFDYIKELEKVDPLAIIPVEKCHGPISFVLFIVILSVNIYGCATMIVLQILNVQVALADFFLSVASHLSHMTRILMFESLWIRVKSLRKTMENWSVGNDVDERQVQLQEKNLEEYLFIYRNIVQRTKTIGYASKFLMMQSLLYSFTNILDAADLLTSKKFIWQIHGVVSIGVGLRFLPVCIPGLFGELINAEVENIKINLARQFRNCNNDALRNKILIAIKYIDMCPIKFSVWRVFSVDISLLLAVFNVCTTYTIVLLQFKKIKI